MRVDEKTRRARWMAAFEGEVLEMEPRWRGRIDWNSAAFYYHAGDSVLAAAEQYVENHKDELPREEQS